MGIRASANSTKHIGLGEEYSDGAACARMVDPAMMDGARFEASAYQEYVLTPKGRGCFQCWSALAASGARRNLAASGRIPYLLWIAGKGRPVRKLELRSEDGPAARMAMTEVRRNSASGPRRVFGVRKRC